ncbi:hypothetical protein RJ640_027898 [Escallonia rubra]|uniref:Retroviral polymerase SH3-like domain-containing protein n=1 Tax=Escallonia rubra TaxID=112253 RepID=A0AA88QTY8_9ASTE|nr:hypothetical protein RJ640_027898 [Escallonia rubra]
MDTDDRKECEAKALSTIRLSLAPEIKYSVLTETSLLAIWSKLEKIYMSKSLTNRLYLKKQLYQLCMDNGSDIRDHLNALSKITMELANVQVKISKEDLAIILLSSLPSAYEILRTTLLVGKDTLTVDEETTTLLQTDSLKDSVGSSHTDGLVARVLKELQAKKKPGNTTSVAEEKSDEGEADLLLCLASFDRVLKVAKGIAVAMTSQKVSNLYRLVGNTVTVKTVCYFINRSPTVALDGKYGKRSKLDAKSRKCTFLDYEADAEGFQLWDPIVKKRIVGYNIVYDE